MSFEYDESGIEEAKPKRVVPVKPVEVVLEPKTRKVEPEPIETIIPKPVEYEYGESERLPRKIGKGTKPLPVTTHPIYEEPPIVDDMVKLGSTTQTGIDPAYVVEPRKVQKQINISRIQGHTVKQGRRIRAAVPARGESGTEVGRISVRAGRPAPQVFDDMGNVIGTTKTTPRPPMTTSTGKFSRGRFRRADVEGPAMAERRFTEEHAPGRSNWSVKRDPRYQSFMNVLSPSRHGIQGERWGSIAQVGSPDDPLIVNAPFTLWNVTLTTPRSPATSWYRPETDEFKVGYNPPLWASREEAHSKWGGTSGLGNQSVPPGTSFTEWESQLGGLMGGRAEPGRPTEISRAVAPDLIEPRHEWINEEKVPTGQRIYKAPPRGALRGKIPDIFGDMFGLTPADKAETKPVMTRKARDLFSGL